MLILGDKFDDLGRHALDAVGMGVAQDEGRTVRGPRVLGGPLIFSGLAPFGLGPNDCVLRRGREGVKALDGEHLELNVEDGLGRVLKGEGSAEGRWYDALGGQAVGVVVGLAGLEGPGRIQLGRAVPIE